MRAVEQATGNLRPRSRSWSRFSLRTFLVAITLLSVVLGMYISRVRNERRAAQAISDAYGAIVYDWQTTSPQSGPAAASKPPGPAWLRKYVGPHWLDRIVEVRLNEH